MRMTIFLTETERQALMKISQIEVREPRDQIRFWLREEAVKRGLLLENSPKTHALTPPAPRAEKGVEYARS